MAMADCLPLWLVLDGVRATRSRGAAARLLPLRWSVGGIHAPVLTVRVIRLVVMPSVRGGRTAGRLIGASGPVEQD